MLQQTGYKKNRQNHWTLDFLGIKESGLFPLLITFFFIAGAGAILYLTEGNFKIILAIFSLLAVVGLTLYRIDYSFFLFFGMVLFFDQYLVPGFRPFTYYVDFFRNFKEISYLPSHPAGVINPVEVYLFLLFGAWMLVLAVQKKAELQRILIWPSFLFFLSCLIFGFLNGIRSGGDLVIAIWEFRALLYLSVMYLIVPQIIQTREQIRILLWICIVAIFFKACQGIYRFANTGLSTSGIQTFTNHEDPVFMSVLFIFLASMILLKYRDQQRKLMLVLLIPFLLGFYLSFRRAAFAGLFVSLATLFFLIGAEERKRYLKLAVPAAIFLLAYSTVFWNNKSTLAQPVQMIKSGLVETSKVENPEDYYSNLYRDYENYNLAATVKRKPLTGVGFGNKYDLPLDLDTFVMSFPLRNYIAHNQILWWFAKTGAIGFLSFWLFFNAFVSKGASVYAQTDDPYLKAVCAMIVVAVINQMVVSYFDLQLTYYRNMIFLGTLMGLMPTIERLGKQDAQSVYESIQ
ncbi:MAG: O-antigen ligase family protein [Gracilimonas sp.]|uniref:O-antigen ligase family protein n=1 Tax=Gracilimonas sp. TaxID=1974203 RepID=UPI0019A7BA42|nr:O-antigen ligase family protein [Gracilimonas sp.]MBD3615450.1 O-antigen ligase family protein [Gracilimonas sp.]